MASTTVVDQLIIKLGLDPRDFTKGEKEVARSFVQTKDSIRQSSEAMSDSIEQTAGKASSAGGIIARVFGKGGAVGVALAAAAYAAKKANDKFYDIAVSTRRLGLDARNFNLTASGLRNVQNASELAGGSLEDATNSAGGLAKSLFDLKFNGEVSQSLITLGRLGVQFTDATGKARDFKDVALDAAEAELAKQRGRNQVTGEYVNSATKRVRAYTSLEQATYAEIGLRGMNAESGLNTRASEAAEGVVTGGIHKLSDWTDRASVALGSLADNARAAGKGFMNAARHEGQWLRQKVYQPYLDAAADKYGIDRDVLTGIARVESNFRPGAEARRGGKVTGRGIMQLNPQFYPNAGQSPINDIDEGARKFAGLLDRTEGTEGARYAQALRMYHAGETNYRRGTHLGPDNQAYAGKVLAGTTLAPPTPSAQGSSVSNNRGGDVTFESITINTQARDANGIADSLEETTRRKLLAAQADVGMQ